MLRLIMEINPSLLSLQISDIVVGQEDNITAREALLRWARKSTARYPGVRVNDFTSSWRDGLAFTALIHRNRPDLIDWREARQRRTRERLETAFHVVDKEYGVTKLLDPQGKTFSRRKSFHLAPTRVTREETHQAESDALIYAAPSSSWAHLRPKTRHSANARFDLR
jgi:Calponin homology (CH) domain